MPQVKKPFIFYITQQFKDELDEYIDVFPPFAGYNKVYFHYLVCHLSYMHSIKKKDEYVTLGLTKLKAKSVSNINRYVAYLVKYGFIISDKKYIPSKKSQYYKLNPEYLGGDLIEIEITKADKMYGKVDKKNVSRKANFCRLPSHLYSMYKEFDKLKIDHCRAKEWVLNSDYDNAKKIVFLNSIQAFSDKRFRYYKRNNTNKRLDTNLTNIKSDLRKFIFTNYISIDLKNSQPFLLGVLLHYIRNNLGYTLCGYLHRGKVKGTFGVKRCKKILISNQNQEKANLINLSKFLSVVTDGELYDNFITEFEGDIKRDEVKEIIMQVLFSRNITDKNFIPYKEGKKIFKSVYPFIYECIHSLKEGKHNSLSIYLQQIESYLFIDVIAKRLVENGITPITIHDSVIVKKEDEQKALDIMQDCFKQQLGVCPSFHIEIV